MDRGAGRRPARRRHPPQHEPDRVDRPVARVREPVRDRRVERDRVARLEDVVLEADPDIEPAVEHVAPLVAAVALVRVPRSTRRQPRTSRKELDVALGAGGQPFPLDARREVDPLARRWPAGRPPRHGPRRLRGRQRRLAAVVEHQLVERHVELGGERVERPDRRVRPPGLDLGDEARRDTQSVGQRRAGSVPARARARATARPSRMRVAGRESGIGHGAVPPMSEHHAGRCRRRGRPRRPTGSRAGTASRRRSRPSSRASARSSSTVALEDRRRLAVPVRAVADDARVDRVHPDRRQLPGQRPDHARRRRR